MGESMGVGEGMAESRTLTCISCPTGCHIEVRRGASGIEAVEGNRCAKGREFALLEVENPVRYLTTTIRVGDRLLPVRSDKPLPKGLLFDCVKVLRGLRRDPPVKLGQPIVSDILGTGVNIVASRDLT